MDVENTIIDKQAKKNRLSSAIYWTTLSTSYLADLFTYTS